MPKPKLVKLSEHSNEVQVTIPEVLDMAKEFAKDPNVDSCIVLFQNKNGRIDWFQGGGLTHAVMYWLLEKMKIGLLNG